MADRGSIAWLNSILTQPGFDPYSAEGSAALSDIKRTDPAFQEIMRLQAMQTNLTPGQAYGWQKFAGQTPDAATAAIADQRFGELNRQSQQFEDSEKNSEAMMQMQFLMGVLGGAAGGYFNGAGTVGAADSSLGSLVSESPWSAGTSGWWEGASPLSNAAGSVVDSAAPSIGGWGASVAPAAAAGEAISGMNLTDPWAAPGGSSIADLANGSLPGNIGTNVLDTVAPSASGVGASGITLPPAWQQALGVEGSTQLSSVLSGASGMAAKTAAQSAISRIVSGQGTAEDYLSVGLKALPGVVGALTSNSQANSLKALSDQYSGYGAPSRSRYEASFQPGFTMENDPGYKDALDQSAKATLHALSVNGNPAGSPNAWSQSLTDNYQKTAYPALQQYRNTNASAGGLQSGAAAAPGLATTAINQNGQTAANLGGAFRDATSESSSLADLLKKIKGASDIFAVN